MVERRKPKIPINDDVVLFDERVNKHLLLVGKSFCKLFWICGKIFISKGVLDPMTRIFFGFGPEDELDAVISIFDIIHHTCAFTLLLAKNMVFKLV